MVVLNFGDDVDGVECDCDYFVGVGHVSFPVWGGVSRLPHTSSIDHVHPIVHPKW